MWTYFERRATPFALPVPHMSPGRHIVKVAHIVVRYDRHIHAIALRFCLSLLVGDAYDENDVYILQYRVLCVHRHRFLCWFFVFSSSFFLHKRRPSVPVRRSSRICSSATDVHTGHAGNEQSARAHKRGIFHTSYCDCFASFSVYAQV